MRLCWTWARTAGSLVAAGRQGEGPEPLRAPAPSHEPFGYDSRSLRSPFFFLVLPFLWSERPSLLSFLSPVRAPPASFIRPLALSIAPSSLSSLPLLPPSRPIWLLLSTRLPVFAGTQPTEGPPDLCVSLWLALTQRKNATERPWPPPPDVLLAAGQPVRQPAQVLGGV